ncbi:MAG: AI-2E family transporter [Methylomonas sp.]|jgi:predicted PurR-regulated permease PerM|uniref:AI-2E family transporter n=1 Tax=Methylomonas sp. TaxID=418 RepID=UPI0025D96488|nr:AI-2E family transporter [Methylomonas sp.]MCK9608625.1 AI-2E family transporter [Methylomonas sp.]
MNDSQKWLVLFVVAGLGWLLYLLAPILMPFAVAAILAYLGDPLVDRLETWRYKKFRLNRTMAVTLVFFGIIIGATAILLVIIPTIEYQIGVFIDKLPSYLQWLNKSVIPTLQKYFGKGIRPVKTGQLIELVRGYWQDGSAVSENLIKSVSHSSAIVLGWMMNTVLIPVITFYLLRDWDGLVIKVHNLFPRRMANTVGKLAAEADTVLGAFLRGQFYVMLALGLIYSIGLRLISLDLALPIGMMAGLISFIPYMGAIVGIGMACVAAILQFQDAMHLVPVLIVFAIGHSLESMLLTPWLVGNKIGLHPVAVIFAVLAGGQLFGFLGVLLALPVASVIMVLLRHIHERYTFSIFYSNGSHL